MWVVIFLVLLLAFIIIRFGGRLMADVFDDSGDTLGG